MAKDKLENKLEQTSKEIIKANKIMDKMEKEILKKKEKAKKLKEITLM